MLKLGGGVVILVTCNLNVVLVVYPDEFLLVLADLRIQPVNDLVLLPQSC